MVDVLGDFAPGGGGAFNIAIYTIISMCVIVGIVYMLAKMLSNQRLEQWSKNEFLQVLVSAAIVGGLFALMNPSDGIIINTFNSLTPGETHITVWSVGAAPPTVQDITSNDCMGLGAHASGTVICYAYDYLNTQFFSITNLVTDLLVITTVLDIISKISIDLIIVEFTPLSGLSSVVQVLNNIIQSLVFLGIVISMETMLLKFIDSTALNIFLPIGVVLRCFFATRRLGGMLIALAVGIYIVFPLAIALNAISVDTSLTKSFEEIRNLSVSTNALNPATIVAGGGDISSTEGWFAAKGNYTNAFTGNFSAVVSAVPNALMAIVSSLLVQIVFLPVISVMITLVAIKEMAAVFGSEVNLSRFEV